ncbi:MAG TPA: helix-turn-helix transcriptional regulator [Roseiarcus sp.]|jgi:transcriptional regulator with XRE-family HTH domain|nr:helix-turn-helix transcriptional regulator [Roseiarcus sp.]
MITPAESKAARGLLGWTQGQLADAARTSQGAVGNFESGKRPTSDRMILAFRRALVGAGVEFTEGALGVRLKDSKSAGILPAQGQIRPTIARVGRARRSGMAAASSGASKTEHEVRWRPTSLRLAQP